MSDKMVLPYGWVKRWSEKRKSTYYFNVYTSSSVWNKPPLVTVEEYKKQRIAKHAQKHKPKNEKDGKPSASNKRKSSNYNSLKKDYTLEDFRAEFNFSVSPIARSDDSASSSSSSLSHSSKQHEILVKDNWKCFIILDTNVLIHHLKHIQTLHDRKIDKVSPPILVIPWVVVDELDRQKNRHPSSKHKNSALKEAAYVADKFINSCVAKEHPRLIIQSVEDNVNAVSQIELNTNDNRILNCCLQIRERNKSDENCHVILLTNDQNLLEKAIASAIQTFTNDTIDVGLSTLIRHKIQSVSKANTPVPMDVDKTVNDSISEKELGDEALLEIKNDLCECLTIVIETELEAVYGSKMWSNIVIIKPPWTFTDTLRLLQKHWIAVFGEVFYRRTQQHLNDLLRAFKVKFNHNIGPHVLQTDYDSFSLQQLVDIITSASHLIDPLVNKDSYGDLVRNILIKLKELSFLLSSVINGKSKPYHLSILKKNIRSSGSENRKKRVKLDRTISSSETSTKITSSAESSHTSVKYNNYISTTKENRISKNNNDSNYHRHHHNDKKNYISTTNTTSKDDDKTRKSSSMMQNTNNIRLSHNSQHYNDYKFKNDDVNFDNDRFHDKYDKWNYGGSSDRLSNVKNNSYSKEENLGDFSPVENSRSFRDDARSRRRKKRQQERSHRRHFSKSSTTTSSKSVNDDNNYNNNDENSSTTHHLNEYGDFDFRTNNVAKNVRFDKSNKNANRLSVNLRLSRNDDDDVNRLPEDPRLTKSFDAKDYDWANFDASGETRDEDYYNDTEKVFSNNDLSQGETHANNTNGNLVTSSFDTGNNDSENTTKRRKITPIKFSVKPAANSSVVPMSNKSTLDNMETSFDGDAQMNNIQDGSVNDEPNPRVIAELPNLGEYLSNHRSFALPIESSKMTHSSSSSSPNPKVVNEDERKVLAYFQAVWESLNNFCNNPAHYKVDSLKILDAIKSFEVQLKQIETKNVSEVEFSLTSDGCFRNTVDLLMNYFSSVQMPKPLELKSKSIHYMDLIQFYLESEDNRIILRNGLRQLENFSKSLNDKSSSS